MQVRKKKREGCKILVVDLGSAVLPFDYYFCKTIGKNNTVDFIGSSTVYNMQFAAALKERCESVSLYRLSKTVAPLLFRLRELLKALLQILYQSRFHDVVYIQITSPRLIDIASLVIAGITKTSAVLHNPYPHSGQAERCEKTAILLRIAKTVVVPSEWTKIEIERLYREANSTAIEVYPHGPIGLSPEAIRRPFTLSGVKKIVFWGNVKKYKGVDNLDKVLSLTGFDFELVILGKWDADLVSEKDRLVQLGATIRDEFLDEDEFVNFLDSDSLFIMPYSRCSQSGVMYTLLFYGRPFIATDVGDIGKFLHDSDLGALIIDLDDPESVLDAVKYVVDNHQIVNKQFSDARSANGWNVWLSDY